MASLVFAGGRTATTAEFVAHSERLGLVVQHLPVPGDLAPFLEQALPDTAASAQILERFPPRPLYRSRDLIVLHPQRADNAELARRFERWHRHEGEEVRYILDGAGAFRILVEDDPADLHVGTGDFINVPSGLEHSFRLAESQRIKAIRCFSDPSG